MSNENPFDLLQEYEHRVVNSGVTLPAADEVEQEWVGLGFRVGDYRLIADMGEVKEILDIPEFTTVPGVKSWMVGVANVRGSLLPLVSLKGFVIGSDIDRYKGRVIVIEYKGFNTGLIVDEIYGMRHFTRGDSVDEIPSLDDGIGLYVDSAYQQGEEHWPVFSFEKMKKRDDFAIVSL